MAYKIRYTAKRSLVIGHSVGTKYEIEFSPREVDRSYDVQRNDAESLDGFRWSTVSGGLKQKWTITTVPTTGLATNVQSWRECLDSTIGGEVFEYDNGDGNGYRFVLLEDTGYKERRAIKRGDGGNNDYFEFRFTIREK